MDCRTAQLLLTLDRPHAPELSPEDRAQLNLHLGACPGCRALEQGERALDDTLGKTMRNVPVPDGLEQQLHGLLNRQDREERQRWWRVAGRNVALAASLLVFVGGILWWSLSHRPTLDPAELAHEFVSTTLKQTSAAEVDEQFRQQGVTIVAPRDLNYAHFVEARLTDYHGRPVPMLLFDNGEQYARVYILRASQFDLSKLAGRYTSPSGYRYFVEVQHRAGDLYAYMIVTRDGNTDWLKLQSRAS